MERNTKEELQEAIVNNLIESDSGMRISAISVLEARGTTSIDGNVGHINPGHFEAWVIVEVPENQNKFYKMIHDDKDMTGMMESEEDRITRITGIGTDF